MPTNRCLVISCKKESGHIYRVPELQVVGPEVRKKWLEVINDKRKYQVDVEKTTYGICQNHFTIDSFVPASENKDNKGRFKKIMKLLPNAVPTILDYSPEHAAKLQEIQKEIKENTKLKENKKSVEKSFTIKERPYKCPHCETKFTNDRNMKRHISTVHEGRRDFKCGDCQQSFGSKQVWQRHCQSLGHNYESLIYLKSESGELGLKEPQQDYWQYETPIIPHESYEFSAKKFKFESPWDVNSLYEFQYFICPSCSNQFSLKQDFVNHTFHTHPESTEYLRKISDESLYDVVPPWTTESNNFDSEKPCEIFVKSELNDELDINEDNYGQYERAASDDNNEFEDFSTTSESINKHTNIVQIGILPKTEVQENDYANDENPSPDDNNTFSDENKISFPKSETEDNWECEICGKSLPTPQKLKAHIYAVHEGNKDFKCDTCGETFPYSSTLESHIDSAHEGIKNYKCLYKTCGKYFAKSYFLNKHIDSVHKSVIPKVQFDAPKGYQCNYCAEFFSLARDFKKHMQKVHEDKKDHKCSICEKAFHVAYDLKQHIFEAHEEQKIFGLKICEVCGKSFKSRKAIQSHILSIHKRGTKYKCFMCEDSFDLLQNLRDHQRANHFKCELCDISFGGNGPKAVQNAPRLLKRHIDRVHKGKRDHTCDLCGKSFYSKTEMEVHRNRHDNPSFVPGGKKTGFRTDSLVTCDICGKSIRYDSQWRHKRLHEGVKDHHCKSCEKSFGQGDQLKRHMVTAHGAPGAYICEDCGKSFFHKGDFRKHIESVHHKNADFLKGRKLVKKNTT